MSRISLSICRKCRRSRGDTRQKDARKIAGLVGFGLVWRGKAAVSFDFETKKCLMERSYVIRDAASVVVVVFLKLSRTNKEISSLTKPQMMTLLLF
jgi:hypothetical protein